jgi:NAD dependent epimerase/dehydratase family enzyme
MRLVLGEMADVVLTGQCAVPAKLTAHSFSFAFDRLPDALASILQSE